MILGRMDLGVKVPKLLEPRVEQVEFQKAPYRFGVYFPVRHPIDGDRLGGVTRMVAVGCE